VSKPIPEPKVWQDAAEVASSRRMWAALMLTSDVEICCSVLLGRQVLARRLDAEALLRYAEAAWRGRRQRERTTEPGFCRERLPTRARRVPASRAPAGNRREAATWNAEAETASLPWCRRSRQRTYIGSPFG
jgi:hypothetical protein